MYRFIRRSFYFSFCGMAVFFFLRIQFSIYIIHNGTRLRMMQSSKRMLFIFSLLLFLSLFFCSEKSIYKVRHSKFSNWFNVFNVSLVVAREREQERGREGEGNREREKTPPLSHTEIITTHIFAQRDKNKHILSNAIAKVHVEI